MSQDNKSLSEIAEEISEEEVTEAQDKNKRVSEAYGADSKGLIVIPVTSVKPEKDELY